MVCEDLTDEQAGRGAGRGASQALIEPFALERAEVMVSASIGIAVTHRSSERPASLLRDADAAMYRAKSRGGARHELFDQAMHTQAVSRLLTERACARRSSTTSCACCSSHSSTSRSSTRVAVEALLRWDHPVRGLVAPGRVPRIAEETGIIVPIGRVGARAGLRASEPCPDRGARQRPAERVGQRLGASAPAARLPRVVVPRCVTYDLDPSTLCLEIAEHALLDDLETTSGVLNALKDIGVQLAIDDFGTGGSSLTYLRRFPFDELKIDRTFVDGLGQSAADDAIVAATIDMAHTLGMIVAAEGVETEVQRLRLVELGCDRAQGYHLGPPEAVATRQLKLVTQQPA